MIKIYHNAGCSKSCACLKFLDDSGKPYQVIEYLTNTPTFAELKTIIKKLGIQPLEVVRTHEPIWQKRFEGTKMSDDDIIRAMSEFPELIERPIVVNGDKAVIARPLDKAGEII